MDLQLDLDLSHNEIDTADDSRIMQLFSRRIQKADTYHRILLATGLRPRDSREYQS